MPSPGAEAKEEEDEEEEGEQEGRGGEEHFKQVLETPELAAAPGGAQEMTAACGVPQLSSHLRVCSRFFTGSGAACNRVYAHRFISSTFYCFRDFIYLF